MADEINKEILITAQAKTEGVKEKLVDLTNVLTDQLKTQKLLELQGKRNTAQYIEAASQVRLTKQAIREHNKELDNTVKAFSTANNSINQNKALLSSLRLEYDRLAQTEGTTAASTLKMQANILKLTETLKVQEKRLGITSRGVGDYEDSIKRALSGLSSAIPGFEKFGGTVEQVTRVIGFLPSAIQKAGSAINGIMGGSGSNGGGLISNLLGGSSIGGGAGNSGRNVVSGFFQPLKQSATEASTEVAKTGVEVEKTAASLESVAPAAVEAEGGMAAVAEGGAATGGVMIGLALALAPVILYLKELPSTGEKVEQVLAGIKAAFFALAEDVAKGDFRNLGDDMQYAYKNAVQLTEGLQELNRRMDLQDVNVAKYDQLIQKNMLLLRNKKITLEQAKEIDKETGELDKKRVEEKLKNARNEYAIAVETALNGKKIDDATKERIKDSLYQYGLEAAQALEFGNEKLGVKADQVTKGTSERIKKASIDIINAQAESDLQMQKAQNRLDIIQQRFGKAAAKFADGQTKETSQALANIREAENTRAQSLARQAELTMAAYGKEIAETDAHYKELIFKEQQFVAQQVKLAKLAKSPEARELFLKAKAKGMLAIDQFNAEWDADIQKHISDNNDRMAALILKSQNDLKLAIIANIEDTETHQIASLELQQQMRVEENEQQKRETLKQINQLKDQAARANNDEASTLLSQANKLHAIQENADAKLIQEAKETADAIKKVRTKALDDEIAWNDQAAIDRAKPGTADYFAAEKNKLEDQATKEIRDATETPDADGLVKDTSGIRAKLRKQETDLDKQAVLDKKNFEIETARQTANALADIAKNSIQRNEQAQLTYLERQKALKLRNTSLTSTQKLAIEDTYAKKEADIKRKAFRQEQEASIGQALINGALAITKVEAQTGILSPFAIPAIIAETVAQVAVIAAQQPPAYAHGGTFKSDGKGAVLPGYSKDDDTNAYLRSGEAVIVSEAARDPRTRAILSNINQAYGGKPFDGVQSRHYALPWFTPGFAAGGVYNSYLPTQDNGLRQSPVIINNSGPVRLHKDDIAELGNFIGQNFPTIDIKDINNAQQRRASAVDRAAYQ